MKPQRHTDTRATFPTLVGAASLEGHALEPLSQRWSTGTPPSPSGEETARHATQVAQRALDVAFTGVLLFLLLPLFLVIALLIKLDSPGPILFTQKRVGKDGVEFPFFKFRSMVADAEAVSRIVHMAQKTDRPRYVCTGNLDHLATLAHDAAFRDVYARASLVLADGAPVLWLSKLSGGTPLRERVTGSDLFWELAPPPPPPARRLFFLGGQPGAADAAAEAADARYPGVQVCGTDCPSFTNFDTPEEQERIRVAVRAAHPDVLLVGLGAPKQEKWIYANKDLIGVPVSVGVGGTFEMAGGVVKRAPRWMQRTGMEWAYRFLQEPTRLWHRYFCKDLPFLLSLIGQAIVRGRRRPGGSVTPPVQEFSAVEAVSAGETPRMTPEPTVSFSTSPLTIPAQGSSSGRRHPLMPPLDERRPRVTGQMSLLQEDRYEGER